VTSLSFGMTDHVFGKDIGGIQIDVFPESDGVRFQVRGSERSLAGLKSPGKQGVLAGEMIQIVLVDQYR
jgi:hypothetical protein